MASPPGQENSDPHHVPECPVTAILTEDDIPRAHAVRGVKRDAFKSETPRPRPGPTQCHDITVYPAVGLAGGPVKAMDSCSTFVIRSYKVTGTADGKEALRAFAAASNQVDIVVTDLIMPSMNGRELVQALHQIRPDLKAPYVSGYTEDEIIRRGLHDPTIAFLQKPFTADELVNKVRSLMDA